MQHSSASFARQCFARGIVQSAVWAALSGFASAQQTQASGRDVGPQTSSVHDDAFAQPLDAASADFQAGLRALMQGRDQEAVTKFQSAYARDANPAALLNLGIAYTNLGHPHAAVHALEDYLSHADQQRDAGTIAAVNAEIARLRRDNGRIGLHLIPDSATIELDSEPIVVRGGELLATPGRHTLSARAAGYMPFSQAIDVVAGTFTLEIELHRLNTTSVASALPANNTPVVTAEAPPTSSEEPTAESTHECVLSQVCMGPVVALLGPPNLVGGGLHARIGRYLGIGVDYQVLPTLNLNPVSFGASLLSANARIYPFGGAFFLSGGIGYQAFRGQVRDGAITISATTNFPALMANIGFMGRSGFVLGADVGLLFPLGTVRTNIQDDSGALANSGIPQADIDAARARAETTVNRALNALPLLVQVNLLRVGYMF